MNQKQRQFLIDRITSKVQDKIKVIKDSLPDCPNFNNYLIHLIMSDKIEMLPCEVIRSTIMNMAIDMKKGKDLFSNDWGREKHTIAIHPRDLFLIPEDFQKQIENYKSQTESKSNEIDRLRNELEMITMRIQLASPSTLQNLINEVDDMGNLSLFDEKLKSLTSETLNAKKLT